uniref:Uncharacterized protein n=1 Tax=Anguilla anguilla TaxID=7936 RepID=A0A0E9PD32_ANGAN
MLHLVQMLLLKIHFFCPELHNLNKHLGKSLYLFCLPGVSGLEVAESISIRSPCVNKFEILFLIKSNLHLKVTCKTFGASFPFLE